MTTRTVTGNVKTLTDSAVSSGTVTFEKVVTSTTGNTIHQFGTTTATTDGSGDFSIALAVPASGSYRYRMILPNGDAFYFSIAAGSSINVATLIVAETITDQDAVVELLDTYFPVDVDDLTTTTGTSSQMLRVAAAGGLEYRTVAQVLADLRDSGALANPDLGVTVQGYDADLAAIAALSPTNDDIIQRKAGAWTNRTMAQLKTDLASDIEYIIIAASDETTALTTGTAKATFRMPYAMTLTGVRASVTTAPTGSTLTVDINDGGTTILSTKLTIDATEKTSTTAATPAVISDTALADDAEITIDIDSVGSTIAGAGLKVTLIGTR